MEVEGKMRARRRARVVFPQEEGPERATRRGGASEEEYEVIGANHECRVGGLMTVTASAKEQ